MTNVIDLLPIDLVCLIGVALIGDDSFTFIVMLIDSTSTMSGQLDEARGTRGARVWTHVSERKDVIRQKRRVDHTFLSACDGLSLGV